MEVEMETATTGKGKTEPGIDGRTGRGRESGGAEIPRPQSDRASILDRGGVRSRIEFAEMSPAGGGKEEKCASDGRYGSTLTVTTTLSGKYTVVGLNKLRVSSRRCMLQHHACLRKRGAVKQRAFSLAIQNVSIIV